MKRALALLFVASLAPACGDTPVAASCPEIPAGACPTSAGGTCDDPACASLWSCDDGRWVHVVDCASADGGAARDAGDAARDASLDAADDVACGEPPTGLQGSTASSCTPELELPDCPVEAIGACAAAACRTGCDSFFACTPSGWSTSPVAVCGDAGLVVTP